MGNTDLTIAELDEGRRRLDRWRQTESPDIGYSECRDRFSAWQEWCSDNGHALLAAARELAELKSAMVHLEGGFRPLRSLVPSELLKQARECGWTPPGEQK